MKNLFKLFLLIAIATTAVNTTTTAQQSTNSGPMKAYASHPELDSVLNTEVLTIYKSCTGWQDAITVGLVGTKISGTVTGTAKLYGTVYPEGTTGTLPWIQLDTTYTYTNVTALEHFFKVPSAETMRYAQYKLVFSGGATCLYTVRAYLLPRIEVVLPKN